jgi:hypothetical protein
MKRVYLGYPYPVTEEEACELFIHHSQMASMFFEAVPDDNNKKLMEYIEEAEKKEGEVRPGKAYRAFAQALWEYHEGNKK